MISHFVDRVMYPKVAFSCFTGWYIKVQLRCKWGTKQWIKSTWETFWPPHVGLCRRYIPTYTV